MKSLFFGLTAAAVLVLSSQAGAQVGVRVGPGGVGVHFGDRDRGEYRDYDRFRYRDRDDWRWRRYRGDCDTFWRHGNRVTVCHRG